MITLIMHNSMDQDTLLKEFVLIKVLAFSGMRERRLLLLSFHQYLIIILYMKSTGLHFSQLITLDELQIYILFSYKSFESFLGIMNNVKCLNQFTHNPCTLISCFNSSLYVPNHFIILIKFICALFIPEFLLSCLDPPCINRNTKFSANSITNEMAIQTKREYVD